MHYLIIYDISSDNKRRQVYKVLRRYGAWKQYSAFEVDLTRTQKTELIHSLENIISSGGQVRLYKICGNCINHIYNIGDKSKKSSSSVV